MMQDHDSENDLFYLVHDVAHVMRIKFDQFARAWGMTRAQCVVLMHLKKHPGWTQNEMACHCEIEPITVARLIDRLEAAGVVERRPDPSDRRVNRLHLKPAADPIIARIVAGRQFALHALLDDMDPELKAAAAEVLRHMKRKLTAPDTFNISPDQIKEPE